MNKNNYIRIFLYCKVKIIALCLLSVCFLSPFYSLHAQQISVVTQNVYNFYNDKPDGKKEKVLSSKNYQQRLNRLSRHIAITLKNPDILAIQEIENFNTLNALKNTLLNQYNVCYQSVLLDGHKKVAINVGYLIQCDFNIKNLSQLFKNKTLKNSKKQLYTRPPLYLNICKDETCFHLINVHLRSMIGLNKSKKKHYVATKRFQQATELAKWIDQFQNKRPNEKLIVLGDFNALKVSDPYVDVLGIIKGAPALFNEAYSSRDLIQQDLYDVSLQIPIEHRFSYRFRKKQQTLDYALVSKNLIPFLAKTYYTKIDYKISDHAALVTVFDFE